MTTLTLVYDADYEAAFARLCEVSERLIVSVPGTPERDRLEKELLDSTRAYNAAAERLMRRKRKGTA